MNWSEQNTKITETEEKSNTHQALFYGDKGKLPLETRRVLVQLLIGPAIDGRRHAKLWPTVIKEEVSIRCYLSELFLTLVIDKKAQIAFIQQADTGKLDTPALLPKIQLTFIDSVLLLYLRQYLIESETQGKRAVITVNQITEYLSPYKHKISTDHAEFTKLIHTTIEKIKKHRVLYKIPASNDRFEISPTLKILFSAEQIQSLSKLYQNLDTQIEE